MDHANPASSAHLYTLLTTSPLLAPLTHLEIRDVSAGCDGSSFDTTVVSPVFAKKRTLQRHRLVNEVLKEELTRIHAWTVKCYTPEEWDKEKAKLVDENAEMDG